ncbi:RICIN domain-containing protein [Embleya sp. AB8]|uniref:RICIN domain-containing protein n=1 Tax=Embleya sp. AB8 TaxID=3156304 RepID=UPI003C767F5F
MSATKWYRVATAAAVVGTVLAAVSAAPASARPDSTESVTAHHLTLRLAADAGQVANVKGGGNADGTPIIQWPWSGAPNERWEATATGGGYYRFASVASGKCLNVKGGGKADGAQVIQWPCGSSANEEWRFVAKGTGYELVVRSSGKCLNVRGGLGQGHELIQYTCKGVANDIWLPVWEPTG